MWTHSIRSRASTMRPAPTPLTRSRRRRTEGLNQGVVERRHAPLPTFLDEHPQTEFLVRCWPLAVRRDETTQLVGHMGQRHVGTDEAHRYVQRTVRRLAGTRREDLSQTLLELVGAKKALAAYRNQVVITGVHPRGCEGTVPVVALRLLGDHLADRLFVL